MGACKARIFESVVAEDDVEFVLNFFGGRIAVAGRDDLCAVREAVLQQDKFVPCGAVAKNRNFFTLFLKTLCKPDGERSLSGAAC